MEAGLDVLEAGVTPEEAARAFAGAVLARDPEGAGALFSSEGLLLTPDGNEVRGRAQVREVLAQMAVAFPLAEFEQGRLLVAGELALASQRWTIATGAEGRDRIEQHLGALLVLIHGELGWRVLVAAPWGM